MYLGHGLSAKRLGSIYMVPTMNVNIIGNTY